MVKRILSPGTPDPRLEDRHICHAHSESWIVLPSLLVDAVKTDRRQHESCRVEQNIVCWCRRHRHTRAATRADYDQRLYRYSLAAAIHLRLNSLLQLIADLPSAGAMALVEHRAFLSSVLTRQLNRRQLIDPTHDYPPAPVVPVAGPSYTSKAPGVDSGPAPAPAPSKDNVVNYIAEEETVRNDYADWFGVSGEWGSNAVLGAKDEEICEE